MRATKQYLEEQRKQESLDEIKAASNMIGNSQDDELRKKRQTIEGAPFANQFEKAQAIAKQDLKEDIAGVRFHRGFTMKKTDWQYGFWQCFPDGGSPTPAELDCMWTGPETLKKAIDDYLNSKQ